MRERLAIEGGDSCCPPPPGWPPSDPAIAEALLRAYHDGSWGRYDGPHGERLRASLAELHGVSWVLTCCSGTFAVEWALRSLRLEPGDEVILAGYDFPGNFRAIEAIGARPVLVDVAPRTWSLDARLVPAALSSRTRAILVSHLHGGLADMLFLRELAEERGLALVEDACQAPGALVQNRPAGSWGDVGVLSFGGSKLLSAGRGGAVLFRHQETWQRAKVYAERGNQAFPLSELQAAVLLPQLSCLADRNVRRKAAVDQLLAATSELPCLEPVWSGGATDLPSYYKLAWLYSSDACGGWSRERWLAAMQAEGVAIDSGFRGFVRRGNRSRRCGELAESARASEQTVLLHHPILLESTERLDQVAAAFRKVCRAAGA